MKRKTISLMLTLVVMSAASVQAQVLIGGYDSDVPATGAILDLQNTDNFKGGLLLPRVALTDMESLDGISGENKNAKVLIGLTVYNTIPWTEGVYTWDGSKWHCMVSAIKDCSFVKDDEDNFYYTAQFGAAGCWMTQNLRSTAGLTADRNLSNSMTEKYYWYPNDDQALFTSHPEYGLLYTWAAATGREPTSDNEANNPDQTQYQGICPDNWHLPSDYEWYELTNEIDADVEGKYSTLMERENIGRKMKSKTDVNADDGYNADGESLPYNAGGFDALLTGIWTDTKGWVLGDDAGFWTSSSVGPATTWGRGLYRGADFVNPSPGTRKYWLISVRCKKN
jgi:uncharacterized protein (TIGR02145 family)